MSKQETLKEIVEIFHAEGFDVVMTTPSKTVKFAGSSFTK